MSNYNVCYGEGTSCSACCGINNIRLNREEKKDWLAENTRIFLEVNMFDRIQVLRFRTAGESFLKKLMIRPDVYVCPFMGFTGKMAYQTGCLLNSEGSPHDQVKAVEAPLNFSFYGENICKTYDCNAKQYINSLSSHRKDGFSVCSGGGVLCQSVFSSLSNRSESGKQTSPAENLNSLTYNKLVSNHNLLAIYQKLVQKYPVIEEKLLEKISRRLEKTEIPVTSFEMLLTFEFFTDEELWHVLGTLFNPEGYIFDAFKISAQGILEGNLMKSKLGVG